MVKPVVERPAEATAGKSKPVARVRPVPAVTRALAVLRLLGRDRTPVGVKAIARELGIVPSTCLHILRVLVDEGLVKVDAGTKQYSLDVGMLSLARSVLQGNPFTSFVQPVLDRVSVEWNVTAIGVEVSRIDHMVVLALSKSQAPFRLHVDVGSRFPTLISATGRLVAAFTELPWSDIERRFKALRWEQPPDIDAWKKEVDIARRKGFSIDRGNYINGVTLVAVPVFDDRNRMTHSLVAAGVGDQLSATRCVELAKGLQAEAAALSELLTPRS